MFGPLQTALQPSIGEVGSRVARLGWHMLTACRLCHVMLQCSGPNDLLTRAAAPPCQHGLEACISCNNHASPSCQCSAGAATSWVMLTSQDGVGNDVGVHACKGVCGDIQALEEVCCLFERCIPQLKLVVGIINRCSKGCTYTGAEGSAQSPRKQGGRYFMCRIWPVIFGPPPG